MDLLKKMLEKDPKMRPTAKEALNHEWIQKHMTDDIKDKIAKSKQEEENLFSVQENMKKFQEK